MNNKFIPKLGMIVYLNESRFNFIKNGLYVVTKVSPNKEYIIINGKIHCTTRFKVIIP